jgi:hypothetical protein
MLALSDHQLQLADALRRLPTERERAIFLRLIDEQLHGNKESCSIVRLSVDIYAAPATSWFCNSWLTMARSRIGRTGLCSRW